MRSVVNQVTLALRNVTAHDQLTRKARTDGLTTLLNRSAFLAAAGLAVTAHGPACSVLFLDLDDFKRINDSLGHQAGDEVLSAVAARLLGSVRPGDLCARLVGDEFAILLYGTPTEGAVTVARRIVQVVTAPLELPGTTTHIGLSVGVATARPGQGVDDLLGEADPAMYAAKANGKKQISVFEPKTMSRRPVGASRT